MPNPCRHLDLKCLDQIMCKSFIINCVYLNFPFWDKGQKKKKTKKKHQFKKTCSTFGNPLNFLIGNPFEGLEYTYIFTDYS